LSVSGTPKGFTAEEIQETVPKLLPIFNNYLHNNNDESNVTTFTGFVNTLGLPGLEQSDMFECAIEERLHSVEGQYKEEQATKELKLRREVFNSWSTIFGPPAIKEIFVAVTKDQRRFQDCCEGKFKAAEAAKKQEMERKLKAEELAKAIAKATPFFVIGSSLTILSFVGMIAHWGVSFVQHHRARFFFSPLPGYELSWWQYGVNGLHVLSLLVGVILMGTNRVAYIVNNCLYVICLFVVAVWILFPLLISLVVVGFGDGSIWPIFNPFYNGVADE
jgi:hypothetical protein